MTVARATLARSLLAAAVFLVSLPANAKPHHGRAHRTARLSGGEPHDQKRVACLTAPVEIVAGVDSSTFSLARCEGGVAPLAVERLSVLARPSSAPKPRHGAEALARTPGPELAPGIRRVDPRLAERLELAVDHFRRSGEAARIILVSGHLPRTAGSYHSRGRALDFRIEGVESSALAAFCKTLPDTGCGYYPYGTFIHMDVRDPGTGHVAWTDPSRPEEPPQYEGDSKAALPALPAGRNEKGDESRPSATADDRVHSI